MCSYRIDEDRGSLVCVNDDCPGTHVFVASAGLPDEYEPDEEQR